MMKNRLLFQFAVKSSFAVAVAISASAVNAADPSAKEALDLKPVQPDVQFERPTKEQAEKCTIHKLAQEGQAGWIVRDSSGQALRRFVDTNKDGKLDLWCYYRDGVEIYRDIDGNFNGKADQYRWLGTAGIRWGIDENEDGHIDSWKNISPEEVTYEAIMALREKDSSRFSRLLITNEELKSIGLDDTRLQEITKKLSTAPAGFKTLAERQKLVTSKTEWTNFGATQPGVLPAGTDGTTKDIMVYENVAAMVDSAGKPTQIAIGTMIQVGATWRLIDLPPVDNTSVASTHFFLPIPGRSETGTATEGTLTPAVQKLVTELEKIDAKLAKAKSAGDDSLSKLYTEKSNITEKLYDASTSAEDRQNWIRQLADSVSIAAQSGEYPEGVDRLKSLDEKLTTEKANPDLLAFIRFSYLRSKYMVELQDAKADVSAVQTDWLKSLETFVQDFPSSPDTAEALLQLGMTQEFTGKYEAAIKAYSQIVSNFPTSDAAKKAAGAKTRLESVGQVISLKGKTLDGKAFDLANLRGKIVIVHYWASSFDTCKQDFPILAKILATSANKVVVIGVNLDNDPKTAITAVNANGMRWPQLFETPSKPGEAFLDGRFVNEMGIFTLPSMLIIGDDGRVINRGIHGAELESEMNKLLNKNPRNAFKKK